MAGIDISKIEGYADMTAEEKVKALEGYTFADPDYSGYVKKETFDKTASDLAKAKKDLQAHMSEEERTKAENEALLQHYKEQAETLQKEKSISDNKAKLISIGYDDSLADATAKAMVEGDMATVLKNQQTVIENAKKTAKGEAMASIPTPNGKAGEGEKTISKEQFAKMTMAERTALFQNNRELYEQLK